MTVRVIPGPARVEKREVSRDRFFFELLHPLERLVLLSAKREADALSAAQILTNAGAPDPYDRGLTTLVALYEKVALIGAVNLLHADTTTALDAFIDIGVFGGDAALAALRKAAVIANEDAPA